MGPGRRAPRCRREFGAQCAAGQGQPYRRAEILGRARRPICCRTTTSRVIFVNPYEDDLALIGTTDIPYEGEPRTSRSTTSEIDYLLQVVNRYFKRADSRASDIVHAFSGVRPLYDDNADNPSAVTRDYVFELDGAGRRAPLLSIFGGKITTYRKLAEHALDRIAAVLPAHERARGPRGACCRAATFPTPISIFCAPISPRDYPGCPRGCERHYGRLYGTAPRRPRSTRRAPDDLGRHFGGDLYEREVDYLVAAEWAQDPDDILWRRTKHGLHLDAEERAAFAEGFSRTL